MCYDSNRFSNYRELTSKFNSTGACGHEIKAGDRIGWHRKHGAQCADCWNKWAAENREADLVEAGYMQSCW